MKKTSYNFKLIVLISSMLFLTASIFAQSNFWSPIANFGAATTRYAAVGFSIGNKGYIGTGYDSNNSRLKDFWEYDPPTGAWTQMADFGGTARVWATSFVIGSKAYVGLGYDSAFQIQDDLWEYDQATNTWIAKSAHLPGNGSYGGVAFSIGTKGYFGTGTDNVSGYFHQKFFEYDPAMDTWTQKNNFPGPGRFYATGFSIGSKGYLGTGEGNSGKLKDFWEYEPTTDTWTQKADFGGTPRSYAVGFGMNGKGYLGTGTQWSSTKDFWEYTPATDTWVVKASVPGSVRHWAVGFAVGNKAYIGTGTETNNNSKMGDFYEYTACSPQPAITPASVFFCGPGGSATLTASGTDSYSWSHGLPNGSVVTPTVTTTYTVTGTNTIATCPGSSTNYVTVVVGSMPANQAVTASTTNIICNGFANIDVATQTGVNYYLRNDANNTIITGPIAGTGSVISISTGNISSSTTFNVNAKRATGGLSFDGVDDEVIAPAGALNFGSDFSVELWVKADISNLDTRVIVGNAGGSDFWLGLEKGGHPAFSLGNWHLTSPSTITDSKWHHLAAVREGTFRGIYIDAVLSNSVAVSTGVISSGGQVEIGGFYNSYFFKGEIDEVKIWNTARTPANIFADMSACAAGTETNLGLYYNFENGAGSARVTDNVNGISTGVLHGFNTTAAWVSGVDNCLNCSVQMAIKPTITIAPITDQTVTAITNNLCLSAATSITLSASEQDLYYSLRDNSTNTIVAGPLSGTGGTLSFNTGVIYTTQTYNVFAASQSAYADFDGINDYVSLPSGTGVPTGNSPYTIEALIKPDVDKLGAIAGWGVFGNNGKANGFRLDGNGRLTNNWWNNDLSVPAGNLVDGQWHHVAATWDGTIRAIYLDAVLIGSDTPGGLNVTQNSNVTIGASQWGGAEFFDGGLDEVRIWSVARTQSQLQSAMNSSLLGTETGLAVYYKFGNGSGTIVTDIANGNNDGTLNNMNTATAWKYYSTPCTLQMSNTPTVTVNAQPTVSVNNYSICEGQSVTIVPTGADTYTITGGSFTVSPTTETSYSITGTSTAGCASSVEAVATVSVYATPTISAISGSICLNSFYTVTPTGADTYTITGGNFTVSPSTTTSYSVTGTSSEGCISSSVTALTLSVIALPTISVNSATICSGSSVAIVPTGADTYTITGNNFTVTPLTSTDYSVTGTSVEGCISSNTAVASVSVNATPTVAVNSGSICSNNSFVIVPSGANTYTITGGNYTVSPLTTTNYSVTGTSTNGCISAQAVSHVTVFATPTLAVNSGSICSGKSFTVIPTNAGTYTITGNNFTVSPATTTSYSVTGTSTAGCVSFNTVVSTVTVFATPTLAVNSATVCSGNSVAIVASGANTYTITGNNFTVTPLTTTSYSVTGTSTAGCISAIAVSQVSVNATPTIAVNSGSICSGSSFTVIPSGANTYTITGNNFTVTPLTNSTYSVTGTGTNGCISASAAVSGVTVFATPTLAVNSGSICSGNAFTVTPSGASTYTITGGNFTVTPVITTSYSVTGTSAQGCAAVNTATSTVSVSETPTVMLTSTMVCAGNAAVITASGANSYIISGGSFTVTPSATTSYTVNGTSADGCVSADAVAEVTVNALPAVAISGNTIICETSTGSLSVNGAATYLWNEGQTGTEITITPSVTTTYSVTGTDANGCTNSANVTVVTDPCTGIAGQTKSNLVLGVYPNPNHGEFVVETVENAEVSVLNSLGQLVHSEKTTSSKTTISIDHLANGIYFVNVTANGNQQVVKIIKE